jgi:hypothetical protein
MGWIRKKLTLDPASGTRVKKAPDFGSAALGEAWGRDVARICQIFAALRIRVSFNTDPDPAF